MNRAISADTADFERQQKQIVTNLLRSKNDNSGIIFCATHNDDVVDLIVQMRRKELNYL